MIKFTRWRKIINTCVKMLQVLFFSFRGKTKNTMCNKLLHCFGLIHYITFLQCKKYPLFLLLKSWFLNFFPKWWVNVEKCMSHSRNPHYWSHDYGHHVLTMCCLSPMSTQVIGLLPDCVHLFRANKFVYLYHQGSSLYCMHALLNLIFLVFEFVFFCCSNLCLFTNYEPV